MTGSQREADEGQELTEREWDIAQCAWNQYDKERAAINHAFGAARAGEDRTTVELEYSLAIVALVEPSMPRPGRRPGVSVPLTLVRDGRVIDLYADRQSA